MHLICGNLAKLLMKKTDVKKKSTKELNKALTENRESLRKLRFGFAGSTKSDTQSMKSLKRNIARIMTELRTPTK